MLQPASKKQLQEPQNISVHSLETNYQYVESVKLNAHGKWEELNSKLPKTSYNQQVFSLALLKFLINYVTTMVLMNYYNMASWTISIWHLNQNANQRGILPFLTDTCYWFFCVTKVSKMCLLTCYGKSLEYDNVAACWQLETEGDSG